MLTLIGSPGTPSVAGQIRRKYNRIRLQKHSPLSATARRLLVQRFAVPRPSTCTGTSQASEAVPDPVHVPDLETFRERLRQHYRALNVEEFKEEKWIVVSR